MESNELSKGELGVYEVGYLVLPSIPEDKLSVVVDSIKKVITKEGGIELDGEDPFIYPLAYTISKTVGASKYVANEAYLGWVKFELDPSKAPAVKEGIEKIGEVLRFLLIKAPRKTDFSFAKAEALKIQKEAPEQEVPGEESPEVEQVTDVKETVLAPTPEEE